MNLKEKIKLDFIAAYKAKDMIKKNFLGVVLSAIDAKIDKNVESTDDNVLKVVKSLEKGINETIEGKIKINESIDEQKSELTYLAPYLPTLMSEEDIRTNVKAIISDMTEPNLGKIMGSFNKQFPNKADNKLVSQIIREELQ